MYKGKFDQKGKSSSTDVKELLQQREQEAARAAARRAAGASQAPRPASSQPAANRPQTRPAPAPQQQNAKRPPVTSAPVKPQKRGPRLGGVIFYTLYFLFILIFFAGTFLGLNWLNGWLGDYEASQPTVKAEQVFQQYFVNADWGSLYDAAGMTDSPYESKEQFVSYMEQKVGSSELSYLRTSNGLSNDKKYNILLGDEKIAAFTLTDRNEVKTASLTNMSDLDLNELSKIPDWQLGSVEIFVQRTGTYRIVKTNGHRALVNGVELDDSHIIQIATTLAEEYLPSDTTGISMCTQEVTGLFAQPTVTVFDEKGNEMQVTYDEDTRTFTERTESNTMNAEQEDAIRNAAHTFCQWMIKEVTNRATVAKYFDPAGDTYSDIVRTTELWMQDHSGYEFADEKISDFTLYNDSIFSARITLTLKVTRTDGTVKDFPYASSMFFQKNDSGSWLCTKATNKDISQPVGKVRLTFMVNDQEIFSNFFETDATEIVTPAISPVPEGQVFTGWARKEVDNGVTTWVLMFQPDESGRVSIPEGNNLEPMTLYALFEAAGSASAGEAVPETTEGGT